MTTRQLPNCWYLVSQLHAHPSWLDKVGWLGYLLGLAGQKFNVPSQASGRLSWPVQTPNWPSWKQWSPCYMPVWPSQTLLWHLHSYYKRHLWRLPHQHRTHTTCRQDLQSTCNTDVEAIKQALEQAVMQIIIEQEQHVCML